MDRPSTYKAQASGGPGGVQVHDKPTRVTGMTVKAAAAATVDLYDGTSTAGALIATVVLGAAGGQTILLPKVAVNVGVFVDRSAAAIVTVFLNPN